MKLARQWINSVIETSLMFDLKKATMYVSPKEVIRATRRAYRGKINKRESVEVLLTIGRPNFRERKFIKLCLKAGEKFPVHKVQMEYFKEAK